jgi:AcrR family transcriptional regulator
VTDQTEKDAAPDDDAAAQPQQRPKRYHHGNLRAVLLQVGGEILEAEGPDRLSLRAVARRAGVSQTAPYNHFDDKTALLAELAGEGFRLLSTCMTKAVEREAPRSTGERLRALGRGYLDFALANRERLRLMFGGQVKDMREFPALMKDAETAFGQIHGAVSQFLEEGNRGPRQRMGPTTATIAAWSMVHGLSALLADHKIDPAVTEAETTDELIDQVLDVFVDALSAKGSA